MSAAWASVFFVIAVVAIVLICCSGSKKPKVEQQGPYPQDPTNNQVDAQYQTASNQAVNNQAANVAYAPPPGHPPGHPLSSGPGSHAWPPPPEAIVLQDLPPYKA